jgi:hypothetical protein
MELSKGNLTGKRKLVLVFLLGFPVTLMAVKTFGLMGKEWADAFSLTGVPVELHDRLRYILFVPLGAIFVVITRLTLGIRVLGPFRSILLAIAFQITGILPGLIFLMMVIAIIAAIRPFLKAIKLPYFGRVSVILSTVSAIMMTVLVASEWLEADALLGVAYFPIVVLCLTGDGFARTLAKEGLHSALWRGVMTALVAVLITLMADIPHFDSLMLRFPEVLFLEIGLIIAIAEYLDLRLLQSLNPKVEEQKSTGKKASAQAKADKSKRRKRSERERNNGGKAGKGNGSRIEESQDLPVEVGRR